MAEVVLTDDLFDQEVIESDIPVLVDFWAEWCVPCKMLGPVVDEVAEEYDGKVKVCKLNVDEASVKAQQYGIQSIPTLLLFNKGEIVTQNIGIVSKDAVVEMFESLI